MKVFMICSIAAAISLESFVTSTCNPEPPCRDPDDLDDQLCRARRNFMLFMIDPWGNPSAVSQSNCTLIEQNIDYETGCPPTMHALDRSKSAHIKGRSMCPFYRVLETDPSRYPPTFASARCRCRKCLNEDGQTESSVCEPLYITERILRRGECINGVYEYKPEEFQRAIACTCLVAKVVTSSIGISKNDTFHTPMV